MNELDVKRGCQALNISLTKLTSMWQEFCLRHHRQVPFVFLMINTCNSLPVNQPHVHTHTFKTHISPESLQNARHYLISLLDILLLLTLPISAASAINPERIHLTSLVLSLYMNEYVYNISFQKEIDIHINTTRFHISISERNINFNHFLRRRAGWVGSGS